MNLYRYPARREDIIDHSSNVSGRSCGNGCRSSLDATVVGDAVVVGIMTGVGPGAKVVVILFVLLVW